MHQKVKLIVIEKEGNQYYENSTREEFFSPLRWY